MLYVPGSILDIPEEGELDLTLFVQDNVTLGTPNTAEIEVTYTTSLEAIQEKTPNAISISSVYPNPFNAACNIDITAACEGDVTIDIMDVNGRSIRRMTSHLIPGSNSITINGSEMPSGVYTVVVGGGKYNSTQKLVLMK